MQVDLLSLPETSGIFRMLTKGAFAGEKSVHQIEMDAALRKFER